VRRDAIVIGGHYDHLGYGGRFSNAPEFTGEVHNGADDNASGIASLIEVARAMGRAPRPARTLVFAAFAGEEVGLRGSTEYVANPPVPVTRTIAMVNLDMVGRAHGRVMVGLFGDAPWMRGLRDRMRGWTRLTLDDFSHGGYLPGQSDDAAFGRAGVPAVAFFTGFHDDYHRPSDDWPRIDAAGGADVANLALALVRYLADGPPP
jgi:Zn-dependent M28 family amino/carboxypeptidase